MRRIFFCFIALFCTLGTAGAMTRDAELTNTTGYNYNYMYPYMNNQMRTNLNPGVTTSQSLSPINTVVKTTKMSADRRVVSRPTPGARSATTTQSAQRSVVPRRTASSTTTRRTAPTTNVARSGVSQPTGRRVVARSGIRGAANARASSRTYNTNVVTRGTTTTPAQTTPRTTSTRCLADYTECMNNYCERANTAYNRCYCSSKLSQIDAQYQNDINSLIKQILTMQNENQWSDAEMNEYWMDTIGKYYDENSWANIDSALNSIDWSDLESRVRGQSAFATGHQFCSQHLTGCYYMANNLRDAYRSEIARDCDAYEQSLQRLKNAAESIVESYK